MNKRVLSICFAVLGFVSLILGKAHSTGEAIVIIEEELPGARIEVTGIGYPPQKNILDSQKRLLARRAAIVDAYRVMSSSLMGVSGYVADGSGFVQTSGYIRGAKIKDIRYYINGKVEVDLALPVVLQAWPLRTGAGQAKGVDKKFNWNAIISDISNTGYPIYYKEKQIRQITEEEWIQLRSAEGGVRRNE